MRSVRPFGTDEGTGTGTALGRNAGRVRGSNQPHRRSDGVLLPDVRGVVEFADGAVGRVPPKPPNRLSCRPGATAPWPRGAHRLVVTEPPDYAWVNGSVFGADGVIDPSTLTLIVRRLIHNAVQLDVR